MAKSKRKAPSSSEKPALKKKHQDELLDEALEETFPASDPVAIIEPAPDGREDEEDDR